MKNSSSTLNQYIQHLQKSVSGLSTDPSHYPELHQWSVQSKEDFWRSLFEFFPIIHQGDTHPVIGAGGDFLHYDWFPNVELNFAQNLLSHGREDDVAIIDLHESLPPHQLTYAQLRAEVASLQYWLADKIEPGDVVAAYMPNTHHTIVAMLATTGLGAVFTSTSCDFGISGVIDRFGQTSPKVLLSVNGYSYNGKWIDMRERVKKIVAQLPHLSHTIMVEFAPSFPLKQMTPAHSCWSRILQEGAKKGQGCTFVPRKFSDPLYIMYSSGTTGTPKCIIHSNGGTLLQHIKELGLHSDLTSQKSLFFFTTCGWMMWNWMVSGLFFGSTIVCYEGSPVYPNIQRLLEDLKQYKIDIWGTSPKFLKTLEIFQQEQEAKGSFSPWPQLPKLERILSTGAPLMPEQFTWVEKNLTSAPISSICGGTDIIGCFFLGHPHLPVTPGEIQCLGLGMDVASFDPKGRTLSDGKTEGELVCRSPFPSTPLGFLNDPDQRKYKAAYFEKFPGVWHHGDYIRISRSGTVRVFGRSDATLNPGGVRIGTAEIYRQTEKLDFIKDSLCIGRTNPQNNELEVVLFVQTVDSKLDSQRTQKIKEIIRRETTPRHVPKAIYPVTAIPYTRSGKKMELLVTTLFDGRPIQNLEAMSDPSILEQYQKLV